MLKLFKPFISFIRSFLAVKNIKLAYALLPQVYSPIIDFDVKRDKNGLMIVNKFILSKRNLNKFKGDGKLLAAFLRRKEFNILNNYDNGHDCVSIVFNSHNIILRMESYDNLKVIEEIFISKLYDIKLNQTIKVVDVGMNVGTAAIYFASFDFVNKVYALEPFLKTYNLAKANIALNPALKNKIQCFNAGLGYEDTELQVPEPLAGSLGGSTSDFLNNQSLSNFETKNLVNVKILSVLSFFDEINLGKMNDKYLLKLDCEGAEYEIIKCLKDNNLISKIDIYMIEYHVKGKKEIIDTFNDFNYTIISPGYPDDERYGMIYAFKNQN